jgi:hypothetical protein
MIGKVGKSASRFNIPPQRLYRRPVGPPRGATALRPRARHMSGKAHRYSVPSARPKPPHNCRMSIPWGGEARWTSVPMPITGPPTTIRPCNLLSGSHHVGGWGWWPPMLFPSRGVNPPGPRLNLGLPPAISAGPASEVCVTK